jgi:hypothetical protein
MFLCTLVDRRGFSRLLLDRCVLAFQGNALPVELRLPSVREDDALLVEIRLSARLVRHVITCLLNIWLIFWLSVSAVKGLTM